MLQSFFQQFQKRATKYACFLALILPGVPAWGDSLEIVVKGVDEPLLSNVRARNQVFRISGNNRLTSKQLAKMREDAELRAGVALRPFGYYDATISSDLTSTGEGAWTITLQIEKGSAVKVSDYQVEITGPGKTDSTLLEWKADWPLVNGSVLNQSVWEKQKRAGLDLAEKHGYLDAKFSIKEIKLDLVQKAASLSLTLETSEQAVMGSIVFNQDQVKPGILANLARFEKGQPYDSWLLEQFRLDLWRTGYFENIELVEERRLEESPPVVNLAITTEPRKLNTYQGSVGYGTDTGARLQAMWTRHLLSQRGDSLDIGFGWQQQYNEKSLRAAYRLPRTSSARQYWTAGLMYRTENQSLKVRPSNTSGESITIARGNIDDYSFRPGWLRIRDLKGGYQQLSELWYLQLLRETSRFGPSVEVPPELYGLQDTEDTIDQISFKTKSAAVGVNWDLPVIRGNGFGTVGHSHSARIFTSNTAWGSDIDFTQAYLSSRWNTIWNDRWKFLLRGEIGYSDARVYQRLVEAEGEVFELSVTELPYLYRFKAGGSQSVRGYGFEDLSNNNIGSNNIITASAELEFRFLENWSAAVFFDAGNAFNDWDDIRIRKGAGVGIRWYSIAGPIRLDFAQALDEPGKPWRIHFTIGSPLL